MKHIWTKALLSTAAVVTLFSACKPKPDTDTPFPQAVSPSVFMGSKNQKVYAIDPTTGVKKWECAINADISSSPVLYNGTLFVGNSSAILFKIDPNTGARDQSKNGFPNGITTTPIGDANFLYLTSGRTVTCIDIKPDTVVWTYDADDAINSSPTIRDTQLVFGCDDGSVYMLDKRSLNKTKAGTLIWKSPSFSTRFTSSPTMDTGAIYIGADNFKMYALKRKDASVVWTYTTGAPIKSSPLVYGGNVIFGSNDNKLYNVENIGGTPRWIMNMSGDGIQSSPYLYGQTVYVGSYDKSFYAVNVLDGSVKWAAKTKGLIRSSPVAYKNSVFFGSYDLNMYALDTAKGEVMWQYTINGLMDCSPSIDPNNSDGNGINSTIAGGSQY